jgi:type IV fimbrial biogenesis protein FimT
MRAPPHLPGRGRRHLPGFTAIELLLVLALMGTLLTLGVPAFASLLRGWRLDATADALVGDIRLARSTATRLSRPVDICAQDGAGQCATPGDWSEGWLVFVDRNADHHPDSADALLVQRTVPHGIVVRLRNGTAADRLSFRPNGMLASGVGGSLLLHPLEAPGQTRTLTVNAIGRVRVDAPR